MANKERACRTYIQRYAGRPDARLHVYGPPKEKNGIWRFVWQPHPEQASIHQRICFDETWDSLQTSLQTVIEQGELGSSGLSPAYETNVEVREPTIPYGSSDILAEIFVPEPADCFSLQMPSQFWAQLYLDWQKWHPTENPAWGGGKAFLVQHAQWYRQATAQQDLNSLLFTPRQES